MPPLAELQRGFVRAVLGDDVPTNLRTGHVPPDEALCIHRDTVFGALTHALRLSYPTVDALVGAAFFERICDVFARQNPPKVASLAAYGEGFADFLAGFRPVAALPCLPDVARLDRAVESALRSPARWRRLMLDEAVAIDLPESLAMLPLTHPADEIRAAIDDDDALAAIDTRPAERFVLVWRKGGEAAVRRPSPAAGCFLSRLLAGDGAEAALQAAIAKSPEAEALQAIQAEIFATPFCTVVSTVSESPS
jgi:hypothetical protein